MSTPKVNTWSTKCQSSNGLKVTLVKKRKSSPEQNDVGAEPTEEVQQNPTVGLVGPRWTIESNRNPCKLVIKRRKTNDHPDGGKDACGSGEPSLKMRIVASTKTSQDSETVFLRVKNWCKQQIPNSASMASCDNYAATDLQSSQPSPKCSGLEGCLAAELFHLQPSPKDSGIDVSSPPRRLDEIHLADVSGCVAMATISDGAAATLSTATSMVVSDVVMAMFSNAESASQDGMVHAVKHDVGKTALKAGEATTSCGDVVNRLNGRTTRRLSNLQSLCSYASPKASSVGEEDRITLRFPSSMFRAAQDTRARKSSASGVVSAGVRSSKRIGSGTVVTETDSSCPGALHTVKKTGDSGQVGRSLASVICTKDSDGRKITGAATGPIAVRKSRSKTKTNPVVDGEATLKDPDIAELKNSMGQTDPEDSTVVDAKSSRCTKEKRSKFQIGSNVAGSNGIAAKICPNISVRNGCIDETDPGIAEKDEGKTKPNGSIIETDRSKDLIHPSITKKDKSKAKLNAGIIETDESKDLIHPSMTKKNKGKAKLNASIIETDGSKDQIYPIITKKDKGKVKPIASIIETDVSKDLIRPSMTKKNKSKAKPNASIIETERIVDQIDPGITEEDKSKAKPKASIEADGCKDQTDSSISKKDTSKAKPNGSIIETERSNDQVDPVIAKKNKSKAKPNASIIETKGSNDLIYPSMTKKNKSKAKPNASIIETDRSKDQIDPGITEEDKSKTKPNTSIEADGWKDQIDSSISKKDTSTAKPNESVTETDRSKDQVDPSIAKKNKSKVKPYASNIETDKSKDQIDPSISKKDKTKANPNASIETDGSMDLTDSGIKTMTKNDESKAKPSILETDGSADLIHPSISKKDKSKVKPNGSIIETDSSADQIDPGIAEEDKSESRPNASILEADGSKDLIHPRVTKKNKSKAKPKTGIIETNRSQDQTDPSGTEKDDSKDQTDPCITEEDRFVEKTALSITSKSRIRGQIDLSMTERERSKAYAGKSKVKKQKRVVDPTDIIAATDITVPAEQSRAGKKRSKGQTRPILLENTKTVSQTFSIGEDTNSKDSAVCDELQSKNQFAQRVVATSVTNGNDRTCAGISGETRCSSQTGLEADTEIRAENHSVPVIVEGTRKRNVNCSVKKKREMKSGNKICPSTVNETNVKDSTGVADTEHLKCQNETSPVDARQMDLKVHASSGCSSMRKKSECSFGSSLELDTISQTIESIVSKASTTEMVNGDEVAKSMKRKSNTEECELIPERQPKRNNSALQARKWHAGSRNSASRRSYGRLCHAAELPPPLLTAACNDPLRSMESSVESGLTIPFLSRPHLLKERRQSGLTASHAKDERSKAVAKSSSVDNGLDQQLSSLYDFEDDSPPVLDFINTSVNGRSIFPHRSRLPWKGKSVGSLTSPPSDPVNIDLNASKSVNVMPTLVQSSLINAVDLPIPVSQSKSELRPKTLTKATGSYMSEFASYVSSRQSKTDEVEECAPVLSASSVVKEAKVDKAEMPCVGSKSLPVSGALSVATEKSSKFSSSMKQVGKPRSKGAMSKCKDFSKPTLSDLHTTSQISSASDVQDICQAVTQVDESGSATSKEKHTENEGTIGNDAGLASALDCSSRPNTLRTVTYHKPVSENTSEISENSVEPEKFDFSLFVTGQKSLARLQDKATRLLRIVCPGIVDLYKQLNIRVVCKLLDQLLDEMACSRTEGEATSRTETCCRDCEVSLCRRPTECLRVFERKVLGLLRILLPSADLEGVASADIELLVDAVTVANATHEEHTPSEKCSNSCLGDSHVPRTVNANSEERCCGGACVCCCQDGRKDSCCHGGEHSHDSLNFADNLQYSADLASTCSDDLLLKSKDSCRINR